MKHKLIILTSFLIFQISTAQTRVKGIVLDKNNDPMPFVNVYFPGTTTGTITDEDGKFYLYSEKNHSSIKISFVGYKEKTVSLQGKNKLNLVIKLTPKAEKLKEVKIYAAKPKNKGNPAVELLKKVWKHKRKRGVNLYDYYEYDKYEKIEFDIYNVDERLKKTKLMKGLEFVFDYVDTSKYTGVALLPIFINEALYRVYGKNIPPKAQKEVLKAHKASGVENNVFVNTYVKDLYLDYDVYANFIRLYGKDFVSPLSKLGPLTYYYILSDTAEYKGRTAYNVVFYPRRKKDLAFKGDVWIADSTFAVLNISMNVSKTANINWVKDFYLEQEFTPYNDSVFVLTKDQMITQLGIDQLKNGQDLLVKRTTYYSGYVFNQPKPDKFYNEEPWIYNKEIYHKSDTFWQAVRPERLNRNEAGVYKMLDSLKKTPKFKRMSDLATILGSGYAYIKYFDYGPVFSTIGYNDVEGIRIRLGGRTYFDTNDLLRFEGFGAYGFRDKKWKYGISGKWVAIIKPRLMFQAGYRKDVEQIGVSLTTLDDDVLSRSFASSSVFAAGDKTKLTETGIYNFSAFFEPVKNLEIGLGYVYKNLQSAHPAFSLDYLGSDGQVYSRTQQPEVFIQIKAMPGRKYVGYGVKRYDVNSRYPLFLIKYSKGYSNNNPESFDYDKIQIYFNKKFFIGAIGKLDVNLETGKTYGTVPLSLLSVVPGNQSFFYVPSSFQLLTYYEFITDTYASLKLMHNFEGRIFSKIPILKKTEWRELVFFNAVWGKISPHNVSINRSGIPYLAPGQPYYEFGAGITNILKFMEFDAFWRGNHLHSNPLWNFNIKLNFRLDF